MALSRHSGTTIAPTTRRTFLKVGGAIAAVGPALLSNRARAAEQVVVRTPGGAYEDAITEAIYVPFTRETGIEVVKVAATIGKLFAMFRSGNIELDVIDTDEGPLSNLNRQGAIAKIDYDKWKFTNPGDIDAAERLPFFVGTSYVATVIAYDTRAFPSAHPKSWADFWDTARFPGSRTLPDMASGQPPLEFALIADGVSPNKLYPLDIDRAFRSLSRIRPAVRKFWDTGAISTQLMTDREAVLGVLWNARVQELIDKGAPLGIEWNEAMLKAQGYSIMKGAKNMANAQKLVDFALQPSRQAAFLSKLPYGPTSPAAIKLMSPDIVKKLPSSPEHKAVSFPLNIAWWEDNRDTVSERWSKWLLSR